MLFRSTDRGSGFRKGRRATTSSGARVRPNSTFVMVVRPLHDVCAGCSPAESPSAFPGILVRAPVWSQSALAFATAYCVLVSIVYFVQLTLIAPRLASGRIAGLEPFRFVPFDSFLYDVDILGYSFMRVSTLFAARVFRGTGLQSARPSSEPAGAVAPLGSLPA